MVKPWWQKFLEAEVEDEAARSELCQRLSRLAAEGRISDVIRALRDAFVAELGVSSYMAINGGECETFAALLQDIMGEGVTWWDDELDEDYSKAHCFFYYRGKYYDAECPQGVQDWKSLPLYGERVPSAQKEAK